ncbi:hypothetical protein ACC696_16400 [Rhizobium ruizarguesonis]
MIIGRREFLTSIAAVAVLPALPQIAMAAPVAAAEALKPAITIWVGGHYGEYDWQTVDAPTREEAVKQLLHYFGTDHDLDGKPYTMEDADLALERAEKLDGIAVDDIKSYHWIDAGFGTYCARCDSECCAEEGARVVECEAVCVECLTFSDKIYLGDYEDEIEEQIVEIMVDNDCNEPEVLEILARSGGAESISPELWAKCLAEARAAL